MRRKPALSDVHASSLLSLLYSIALAATGISMPLVALRSGYSVADIGLFVATSAASQVITRASLPAALRAWTDRSLVMCSGVLLAVVDALLVLSSGLLLPFLTAAVGLGAARAIYWTAAQTHVLRSDRPAVKALGQFHVAGSLGTVIGPVAAGALSNRSPAWGLVLAIGFALASVLPARALDRLPCFHPRTRGSGTQFWRRPGIGAGCVAVACDGIWRALLESYVPVILDAARYSSGTIGALVSGANAASAGGSMLVLRGRRTGMGMLIPAGLVVTGLGVLTLVLSVEQPVAATLAIVACGLGSGALQTLGPSVTSMAAGPNHTGDAVVLTGTVRSGAYLVTPLAVVGLVTTLPLTSAVATIGVVMAAPAMVLVVGNRRGRR